MTIQDLDGTTSLESLMESAKPKTPATGVARRAEHRKALENFDIDHLLGMQDELADLVNHMSACTFITEDHETLSENRLELVMTALDSVKNAQDFMKSWYELARLALFTHITNTLAANGVEDPEWATGEAPVPALGRKFTREGGKAKLTLDHTKLAEGLGEQHWNNVHTTKLIPARTETVVDEDKLVELVANNPELLEVFKTAVRVDSRTSQRLNTREIEDEEE